MVKHFILVIGLLFITACSENYSAKALPDELNTNSGYFNLASANSHVLVDTPNDELSFIQTESFGGLTLGMTPKQFTKRLPCTVKKDEPVLWDSIGEIIQEWNYADCGIKLQLSTSGPNKPQTIFSIKATNPSQLKTNRNIGIGSDFAQVIEAYSEFADYADNQAGETFIAGSTFGGLFIRFVDNRVSGLFLGASAE